MAINKLPPMREFMERRSAIRRNEDFLLSEKYGVPMAAGSSRRFSDHVNAREINFTMKGRYPQKDPESVKKVFKNQSSISLEFTTKK
ncbi:MAG: hypothetical protein GY710_13740 [Desulfobacteraceae bacterium]|nr:hypothetical protein [Desulfobacteraceae bacterium]